ncbi:MAG TPA: diguanylate cyclase [Anaerolineales bacterium]|nr:diguanylate cyclase [Anaerolineales bacterium]
MNRILSLIRPFLPHALVVIALVSYVVIFAGYRDRLGTALASLATIPVVVASWYFGVSGGVSFAVLTTIASGYLLSLTGVPLLEIFTEPSNILRVISLFVIAIVTGRLSNLSNERLVAFRRLERYEQHRRSQINFLEILNQITTRALEADNLESTLEILTEQITRLFKADDGFFAFWDPVNKVPIPRVAFGSLRDVYPGTNFEPGQQTLTASVMEAGRPIAVLDVKNSPHISPRVASLIPSCSMLGVPLIAQERKLGALLLGYNNRRQFEDDEIAFAGMMGEQLALVLSKSLTLEEERNQLRQLTALHDVALTSIEADDEDQLIERVTGIIGQNLFPDNFGIMLLDENGEFLHVHHSYRFVATHEITMKEVPVGLGITGEVAITGKSQRLGNVRQNPQYIDVDERIVSELCVPIKFKEQILGVINAESVEGNAFTADDERLMITLAGQLATAIEQLRKARAERNWLDQLAHSNDLIYIIAHITSRLESTLTMEEIIQRFGAELRKINLTCIMAIYDAERESFTINYTSLPPDHLGIVELGLGYPMLHFTFPGSKLSRDMLLPAAISRPEDEIESLFTGTEKPGVLRILGEMGITPGMEPLRLPLIVEGALLGILWIWGRDIRNSDLPILSIFVRQIGVSLERARLFQEVQNLAVTDPLTGLHNRRSLYELGKIEFVRAKRLNRPFSCLMVDLDHFKEINDNHGHPFGDIVLQEFARLCMESVREIDLVGRYGGEELLILMPETELERAVIVAERLRLNIAGHPISTPGTDIQVTTSIGVATRDQNTAELDTLVARADQAMYIAKHLGRNRVAVSK